MTDTATDVNPYRPSQPDLEPYREAGVLGPTEIQAASTIARLQPDTPNDVLLAFALAMRAPIWGHVCVDLMRAAEQIPVDDPTCELPWPDAAAWIELVRASPLVRPLLAGEPKGLHRQPMAIDGSRLYLDRFARYEQLVAEALRARAKSPMPAPSSELEPMLDDLFSSDPTDTQRAAAKIALTEKLAIIAGGPGTGKTRTVARMLIALLSLSAANGTETTVALAAPTGKAAARMTEAVQRELSGLDANSDATNKLVAIEATTIHRLLGPGGGNRFAHDRLNPLPFDVVVVDETSMVSLPLMARLLDSLRPEARVILVGDPFQLASVEAGAVLGDLIDSSGLPDSVLRSHTVALDRVHRFSADSGIAALATAIRNGDDDAALRILRDPDILDATLIDPADSASVSQLEDRAVRSAEAVIKLARAGDAAQSLHAATDFKVLSATKKGPLGVDWWSDRITQRCTDAIAPADQYNPWYVGRPIMVTQNDPVQKVFNGDIGVVVDTAEVRSVAFPDHENIRSIPAVRLGAVQTWWAMTIHKSQGSEFPHIVVALPSVESPVVSRELLYTGVTRAKESVTIVATEAALRAGINKRVVRTSGLATLLGSERTPT